MRKIESESYQYINGLISESPLKLASREAAQQLNKESISLSPTEGALLRALVATLHAKKGVELGCLTGLSAQYLLDAMAPEAVLWTLEKDSLHVQRAREILLKVQGERRRQETRQNPSLQDQALQNQAQQFHGKQDQVRGVSGTVIHVLEGDARESLIQLQELGPFDFVFIDANKSAYLDYYHWADRNIRPGGMIIADNVFLGGSVWNPQERGKFSAKQTEVMQMFNRLLMENPNYNTSIIPTEEGLLVAVKRGLEG